MKKIRKNALIMLLIVCCICMAFPAAVSANVKTKSRTIHIVYDDSGSMAVNGITSWSQAKYAMEVFAAMMGESDTLKIYPMTSYSYNDAGKKSGSWGKKITIKGTDSAEERVDTINRMNGDDGEYGWTPIQSVSAAGDDLKSDSASEKWLVVLTDGAFDGGKSDSQIDPEKAQNTILSYANKNGINVIYLAIGKEARDLASEKKDGFYPLKAASEDNILEMVTTIAKTVFNYQSITVSGSKDYTFSADIPLSKIIIFAQGEKVKVGELKNQQKSLSEKPVSVDVQVPQDTPFRPKNPSNAKVAEGLNGSLVTYTAPNEKTPFSDGNYSFSSNVSNIEVFFEPGVEVQTVVEDANGNEINLDTGDTSGIEAGQMRIRVKIINPLTGEEINPMESDLLQGCEMSVQIKDGDGKTSEYTSGEEAVVPEGKAEFTARIRFKGDIEKSSTGKVIDVKPAKLGIGFEQNSYKMDIVTLTLDNEIIINVTKGDKTAFSAKELDSLKLEASGIDGLDWTFEKLDDNGKFKVIPKMKKGADLSEIPGGQLSLNITASLDGKPKRSGSGSAPIMTSAAGDLTLELTAEVPDAKDWDGDGKGSYMFNPELRGPQKDAPYILVTAKVVSEDGISRDLTEAEWEKGVKSFSFDSSAINSNFLTKLISLVCAQSVDFEVVKGEEPSTYRLYLGGITATGVRPYDSLLGIKMNIKMENGLKENGETEAQISIRPLSLLMYLGRFLLVLLLLLLLLLFVFLELTKKRFDRNMAPNTSALLTYAGRSMDTSHVEFCRKRVKYRLMPPWRAEERDIQLYYPDYQSSITFHCVAIGDGNFKVTNPERFRSIAPKATFNGQTYEEMKQTDWVFNSYSQIVIQVSKRHTTGQIIMSFYKPD